jgi:hypothetical protein
MSMGKLKGKRVTVCLRVPDCMVDLIKELAVRQDRDISAVVRQLLDDGMRVAIRHEQDQALKDRMKRVVK